MGWLFGQVWGLCLVAFLLGALVTWSAFVMPLRRTGRPGVAGHGWSPALSWPPAGWARSPGGPAATAVPEQLPPAPAADSALATLDSWVEHHDAAGRPPAGDAAAGALDLLGVDRTADGPDGPLPPAGSPAHGGGGPDRTAAAIIPTQPGPPHVSPESAPEPPPSRPAEGDTGGTRPPP